MKPLAGISVVEAYGRDCPPALRIAGALAGRMLADLGATVVVPRCRSDRDAQPKLADGDAIALFLNAGKSALRANDPAEDLKSLLAASDAAIVDDALFRGLPPDAWPKASAVLSLFGRDAASVPGSEFTVMALSGVLDIVGDPEREPLKLGGHQAAYSAGLSAFTGLLAALCMREQGDVPDGPVWVSLLDTMIWINWKSAVSGQTPAGAPSRQGSMAEWQVVRCADGFVALVHQDTDWPALRAFVDDRRLDEPRFATAEGRRRNARDLASIIESVVARYSREDIRAQALARRLPLGAVWSPAELLEDRQYEERGVFARAGDADATATPVMCLPVRWDGARLLPGAALGDS